MLIHPFITPILVTMAILFMVSLGDDRDVQQKRLNTTHKRDHRIYLINEAFLC